MNGNHADEVFNAHRAFARDMEAFYDNLSGASEGTRRMLSFASGSDEEMYVSVGRDLTANMTRTELAARRVREAVDHARGIIADGSMSAEQCRVAVERIATVTRETIDDATSERSTRILKLFIEELFGRGSSGKFANLADLVLDAGDEMDHVRRSGEHLITVCDQFCHATV